MTYPQVICIGEILFDRLSNQLGKPLETVEFWTDYPGGAPANTACGLVKLGIPTAFIGCIGEDQSGDQLVELLTKTGVNITGVQRHSSAPTRIVYVVRDEKGDRSFAGFGDRKTTEFADTYLQSEQLPKDLFKTAKFLVLGTLELAYQPSQDAILTALKLAKNYQVKLFIDINWRPMFWKNPDQAIELILNFVKNADFLKLTNEEAELLFNTIDPKVIAKKLQIQGVFVTAGERGCAYYLAGNYGKIPAFYVNVTDTTGAGDGFTAGIIYQFCKLGIESINNPQIAEKIVKFASAVGALTTTKPGAIAAQPTLTEVETFLDQFL
ncbi:MULTISPECIES: carbohydrate kinase family protein [Planktothrix]|jgi:fructokinase|uniref:PfkB protein n=2 Tax=Planktothrix TaxID=54304 RepID=A0A4P5ZTA3_PLAAG|nr:MULTISPECIES: carbohydrate kinase [Planktothrix]CAD5964586.1 putative fructokinase-5 [Planktothrix rubescens]CAC5343358.1 Sugar kinase, ribokinase family [Planktothrix rubescens NIVA-CYA 18]CAD5978802.1 putative fructokinase-5 [Planktothrix rubescens NIVA-CYA 18]CAH2574938.1 putative fructokinase-5 [Planktothrix rubescens]GDZ92761.1 PfkB protein [Planktothrix agardhii CCAP 1459/11A]